MTLLLKRFDVLTFKLDGTQFTSFTCRAAFFALDYFQKYQLYTKLTFLVETTHLNFICTKHTFSGK